MAVSLLSSVRSARASVARAVRRRAAAPWARLRVAAAFFAVVERLVAPALREVDAVFVAVRVVVRRVVALRAVLLRAAGWRAVVLRVVPVVAAMRAPLSKFVSSNLVQRITPEHTFVNPPNRLVTEGRHKGGFLGGAAELWGR